MKDIFAESSDEEETAPYSNHQTLVSTDAYLHKKTNKDDDSTRNNNSTTKRPKLIHISDKITQVSLQGVHSKEQWDNPDGYYQIRIGELLDNRYCVKAFTGQGVFSNVVKARDEKASGSDNDFKSLNFNDIKPKYEFVAIKILRNNEAMRKAGLKELQLLSQINASDPKDLYHCVRLYSNFNHRNHLCLVFESLNMNLREVLKKHRKSLGPNIMVTTKLFGRQLLSALRLLQGCKIVHADIKPDNILLNDTFDKLKLCDFGSASKVHGSEITPYLVSRYYRAPEITLGLEYDFALDLWSVGCTLYEIYTGKIMFAGKSNNHMLKLMMDLKGKFSNKMLRRGKFTSNHFDDDFNFLYKQSATQSSLLISEQVSEPQTVVVKSIIQTRDLKKEFLSVQEGALDVEYKEINLFRGLLDKIFTLDPLKRPSLEQLLNSMFFKDSEAV